MLVLSDRGIDCIVPNNWSRDVLVLSDRGIDCIVPNNRSRDVLVLSDRGIDCIVPNNWSRDMLVLTLSTQRASEKQLENNSQVNGTYNHRVNGSYMQFIPLQGKESLSLSIAFAQRFSCTLSIYFLAFFILHQL